MRIMPLALRGFALLLVGWIGGLPVAVAQDEVEPLFPPSRIGEIVPVNAEGFAIPNGEAGEIRQASLDTPRRDKRLEELTEYALTNPGDPQKGRQLFHQEQLTRCIACHRVQGRGGNVGPDLSGIGGKFDRPHLIESLLEPSQQIVEGFRVTSLALRDGQVLSGIIKTESQAELQLVDAQAKWWRVRVADIEERQVSSVSLMPEGLAKDLTNEQFTDLIAYLESLRTGSYSPGSRVAGGYRFPEGFKVETVATGFTAAVGMELLPDGRILVTEQTGQIRMIKHGKLLEEPVLSLDVERNRERGLLGVTIHPEFPQQPYVYACYIKQRPFTHHVISRWKMVGDRIDPATEEILLEGDDQNRQGGNDAASAQGGTLHFGPDGCLYVSIGEQTAAPKARDLDSLLGKIIRLHADGSIPVDNPFYKEAEGKYRAIWAGGLRNPYTFAHRPGTNQIFVNDVGGRFEEINVLTAGADAGWNAFEHGPVRGGDYVGPIHYYPQACICGAAFAPPNWPALFRNRYFFADFVHGWIRVLNPDNPREVLVFAEGLNRPVDIRFGSDGTLYVLTRNAWVLDRYLTPNTGTLIAVKRTTAQ
jgi:putative heme-binding domain-containing protein